MKCVSWMGDYWQAWQPELSYQGSCGWRREEIFWSCPLIATWRIGHTLAQTHVQIHTNKWVNLSRHSQQFHLNNSWVWWVPSPQETVFNDEMDIKKRVRYLIITFHCSPEETWFWNSKNGWVWRNYREKKYKISYFVIEI